MDGLPVIVLQPVIPVAVRMMQVGLMFVVTGKILLHDEVACFLLTVVAICAVGSVVFFFSVLLSVFRSKHEGYPYRYTFLMLFLKTVFQFDHGWMCVD